MTAARTTDTLFRNNAIKATKMTNAPPAMATTQANQITD